MKGKIGEGLRQHCVEAWISSLEYIFMEGCKQLKLLRGNENNKMSGLLSKRN